MLVTTIDNNDAEEEKKGAWRWCYWWLWVDGGGGKVREITVLFCFIFVIRKCIIFAFYGIIFSIII